jgi:hypothetical protein
MKRTSEFVSNSLGIKQSLTQLTTSEYPSSLDYWPLLQLCVVSAIVVCILKILRDCRR